MFTQYFPSRSRRWGTAFSWGMFGLILILAPLALSSSFSHTLLSQIGIAIIVCLAYNILLGQGGMLSFGHAVYSGLGAFMAIHTLNLVSAGRLALPVSLIPLVGGLAGLAMALLLGWVSTRRAATPFAMITLGVGELVWAITLMFPGIFGGETGIAGNRVTGSGLFGITFGPQIQLYYLIAAYTLVCVLLMYAFTRTPLGRLLNAVRDNPERVEFIGFDPQMVRYLAFCVSGFFAGVSGGLGALQFEIVSSEVVGAARSGAYLLFVVLGGTSLFFGPIIGAVLMVLASVWLSELTAAWLLYLGLVFMVMVLVAPGGLASLVVVHLRYVAAKGLRNVGASYLALASSAAVMLLGGVLLVEMIYHRQVNAVLGPTLVLMGVALDLSRPDVWFGATLLFVVGALLFAVSRRPFDRAWAEFHRQGQDGRADRPSGEPA